MHELRFRQVHLDFHTSPLMPAVGSKFDKKLWQERLQMAHVDSITCFSLCHHGMSYHPTKIGKMHPNLNFNLLRAQIDACHEIGVKVPMYISAGCNQYILEKHPEWRDRMAGDPWKPFEPYFFKCCFNTPYLDYLCSLIREAVEMFPDADGVFLDIISQAPCACPACVKSMLDKGMNPESLEDRKAHAEQVLLEYYRRSTEACRWKDPDMPVFHNSGHVKIGNTGILKYFSHLELESLPTGGWGYDHYPLSAAYSRKTGLDFLGMTGKFHSTWGEFGGFKHPNALRYECAAMIANNSKCSVGDQLHPSGMLDESTCKLIGEAYKEVEVREPWCRNAKCVANTAILALCDSQDEEDGHSIVGASRFLLESHIPFDIVDSSMDFSSYKVVIVPSSSGMTAETAAALKTFIAKGGKVVLNNGIVFGKNGEFYDFGIPGKFGEQSEFAPDYIQAAPEYAEYINTPFLMRHGSRRFTTDDAHSLGKVFDPEFNRAYNHFCSHQHAAYRNEPSGYSAGAITDSVLYFAHPVFKNYERTGMVCAKEFISKPFEKLIGDDRQIVCEKLPSTGRVTLMKQPGRYIMHALYAPTTLRGDNVPMEKMGNYQWTVFRIEVIEDLLPLYGTKYAVKVPETVKSVKLQPENKELPFEIRNGRVEFTIPEFTCHAMVEMTF